MTEEIELKEVIARVHEALEGRDNIDGYDLFYIEAFLCELQQLQEKPRWKSLETEPPSELQYDKMYLLRTESGSPYLAPLPYKESIKEFISYGFIEWKEIE